MTEQKVTQQTCRYCGRGIVKVDGVWVDPEAAGDDSVWRETCDMHDTFDAVHEPTASSYTQGPWTTGHPHEVVENVIRVYGSDEPDYSLVAEVWMTPAGGDDEGEANARLIAAAPDLLDALRIVEAHTDREWMCAGITEDNDEGVNRVRRILHEVASEAIRKATG